MAAAAPGPILLPTAPWPYLFPARILFTVKKLILKIHIEISKRTSASHAPLIKMAAADKQMSATISSASPSSHIHRDPPPHSPSIQSRGKQDAIAGLKILSAESVENKASSCHRA